MFKKIVLLICLILSVSNVQGSPSTDKSLLVQAQANPSTPSITLSWTSFASATGYTIQRKFKTSTTWGSTIATLGGTVNQWVDNSVSINTYYEYKITRNSSVGTAYGYVASAIKLAPIEYRGRIIIVVDNTFSTTLSAKLTELQDDLRKDGWKVSRIDVSRNETPANVKSQIQSLYNSDPNNFKSVLLIGHIPVYRSGNIAPDGHSSIPWACDAYYGEMNGTWSTPLTTLPSDVELEVGRIDFFNLPAFSLNEQQLLSNYLTKLHNYKIRQFSVQNRMLVQDNFNTVVSYPFAENGLRTGGPLVGASNITQLPTYTNPNWSSRMSEGWLWGYFCGGGTYTSADGVATTSNFAAFQNNVIFNMSIGSYFGNWDCINNPGAGTNWNNNTNNLLRAIIASGNALTSVWAGMPNWFFHHMGLGDPIGYSVKVSMNNRTSTSTYQPQNNGWQGQNFTTIHLGLMGDPSLRMSYLSPPSNLNITQNGSNLSFSWTPSNQQVEGYYLYRIINGIPTRAHPNLITSNTITGNFDYEEGTEYMVRAVKLQTNTSGSFFDLSLGAIAVVPQLSYCTLQTKLFLQGSYNGTNMNDNLRSLGLIPLIDPYQGLSTTTPSVLQVEGSNAIVDWVFIEVRNSMNPSQIEYATSALIQRDGDVVSTNGTSPIIIPLPPENYYIVVKHRNHLGVSTSIPISLTINTILDFTSISTWGEQSTLNINGVKVLWAGDSNSDGIIKYTGSNNDRDLILNKIGGIVPTNTTSGYFREDVNMDGWVKYTGANNDRDLILFNIGGIIPTNIKISQFP